MYHCGVVGALLALTLSSPATSVSGETSPSIPNGPSSKLETTCYFGEPSESCTFACSEQSLEAYCDDEKKQCSCRPPPKTEPVKEGEGSKGGATAEGDTSLAASPTDRPRTNFHLTDICMFGFPSPSCSYRCSDIRMKAYCDSDQGGMCACRSSADDIFSTDWVNILKSINGGSSVPQRLLDLGGSMNPDWLNLLQNIQIGDSGLSQSIGDGDSWEPHMHEEVTLEPSKSLATSGSSNETSDENDPNNMVFYVFDLDSLIGNVSLTTESPSTSTRISLPTVPDLNAIKTTIEGWDVHYVMAAATLIFICGLVFLEISYCFKKQNPDAKLDSTFPTKK